MPAIFTRGGMSAKAIGFTSGALGAGAWIGVGYNTTSTSTFTGMIYNVNLDASGNILLTGTTNDPSFANSNVLSFLKLSSFGIVQLQKSTVLETGAPTMGYGASIDGSGNIYVAGRSSSGVTSSSSYWVKFNSAGTLQSQVRGYPVSGSTYNVQAAWFDSSNNCYIVGGNGSANNHLLKYDTTGAVSWLYRINNSSVTQPFVSGYTNASGSSIVSTAYGYNPNPCVPCYYQYNAIISGVNSSGTVVWSYSVSNYTGAPVVHMDSSGNGYAGIVPTSISAYATIKLNSSGVTQWIRSYSIGNPTAITTDSSGNVYTCFNSSGDSYIVKYNSSGAIQWQRKLNATYSSVALSTFYIKSIIITSDNYMILGGWISNPANSSYNYMFSARLPVDGSKTGSVTVAGIVFTYATASGTDAAATNAPPGGANSSSSTTITVATPNPTTANSTLTETVTNIP